MAGTVKRKRACKPKVRTGCITCKTRRVKCDEAKPHCVRCQKFGLQCDGYRPVAHSQETPTLKGRLLLPKSTSGYVADQIASGTKHSNHLPMKARILVPNPLSGFPSFQDDASHRYFKVFQEKTAPELSGYFATEVWTRSILQVCHEEAFACHAVIAIGALHTAMDTVQSLPPAALSLSARTKYGEPHHKFALKQYGKALKLMRELPQWGSDAGFRNTLISCLLTTCFENYVGNQDAALAQAQAGMNILIERERSLSAARKLDLSYFLRTLSVEDIDLFSTFARLETLVMMFQGAVRHVTSRSKMPLGPDDSASFRDMPAAFESVREARFCWDLSVKRALQWREAYLHHSNFSTFDFGENDTTDGLQKVDAFAERLQLEGQLYVETREQWRLAFQPLFDRASKKKGSQEFLSASILMIQFLSSYVVTSLKGHKDEARCDEFLQHHVTIVDLARDLLETFASRKSSLRQAVFIFDDGLVIGLFHVATRCRDGGVRRRAIELLQRHPRREGLWDSEMAAKVSTWVMHKEEEEMVDGYIPEMARLRISNTKLRLSERTAIICCSKLIEECEERVELPEVILAW